MTALERLGGVFIAPRRTLRAIAVDGAGRPLELLPLFVLVVGVVQPTGLGQALLVARTQLGDGLLAIASLVMSRMSGPVIGAAVFAFVLWGAARARRPELQLGFDGALDAALYALLPYLVLAALGGALAERGLEAWFLPHRLLRGAPEVWAARLVAGYGWSLTLGAWLAYDLVLAPGPKPPTLARVELETP